ncbi:MAG: T9SS type A sorting domain-containing protein, partial [Bacteroidota bacterium]
TFLGLAPGTYLVKARSGAGCASPVDTVTIIDAGGFTVSPAITDISCVGETDGSISLTTGAAAASPLTYTWTPNVGNGATVSGLAAGTYDVMVVDANGCQGSASATVDDPGQIQPSPDVSDVSCFGENDGSIDLALTVGGTPPYEFSIDGGASFLAEDFFDNLSPGTYDVEGRDANGCAFSVGTFTLEEPDVLAVTPAVTDASDLSASDGEISLSVTGGNPPYDYDWTPALPNTPNVVGLSPGEYTIVIEDDRGCSLTETLTVGPTSSVSEAFPGLEIALFPVPFTSELTLQLENVPNGTTELQFELYDALGKLVYTAEQAIGAGTISLSVDDVAAGIYNYRISIDGELAQTGRVQRVR